MVIGKKTKPVAAVVASVPVVVVNHQQEQDIQNIIEEIKTGKLTSYTYCSNNNLTEINNEEIIKTAIAKEYSYDEFKFASKHLKTNRQFISECLAINGGILKYLSKEFKNDEELVLIAVKCYGWSLVFASDSLKSNKKIVEAAIQSRCGSLIFADKNIRNDEEIAKMACKINEKSFDLLSYEFKEDISKMRNLYDIVPKLKEMELFTELTIRLATDSYINNNYKESLKLLSQSLGLLHSNNNYPFALRILGEIYELGKGVPKNPVISKFYYKKAADMNEPFSLFKIAKIYQEDEDEEKALKFMKKSADIGYPPAMMCTAEMLNSENSELSIEYCNKAINCGYPNALFLLAKLRLRLQDLESKTYSNNTNLCYYGWNLKDDVILDEESLNLINRAAEKGCSEAQIFLGAFNLEKSDTSTAFGYYLKSAKSGNMFAQKTVAIMYYYGTGVVRNMDEYHNWLLKSANEGLVSSKYEMGLYFENNIVDVSVGRNIDQAIHWYFKTKDEDADARFKLFKCFMEKKMPKQAICYLKEYLDCFENDEETNNENTKENNESIDERDNENNDWESDVEQENDQVNSDKEENTSSTEKSTSNENNEENEEKTEDNEEEDNDLAEENQECEEEETTEEAPNYTFSKYLYGLICYFSNQDSKHYLQDATVSNIDAIKSFKTCSACENEILGFYETCTKCSTNYCSQCCSSEQSICSDCGSFYGVSHLISEYSCLFSYLNRRYPRTKLRKYLKKCENYSYNIIEEDI